MEGVNLEDIIKKLKKHNLAEETQTGYRGEFSVREHGMLLSSSEFEYWLSVIHEGSAECKKDCNDLHVWGFETYG